jgi:uncharacterized protein
MRSFTLLIKPSGSDCNLDCTYCFYKTRSPEFGRGKQRMSDEVLETLVRDYMRLDFPVAGFAWQGGEPTLMGIDFYRRVVELQKKYGRPGCQVSNALQTNAVLLDDEWCRFLHNYKFLLGISIDGPKEFHDYYRCNHSGAGTFDKVVAAIQKCKEYQVEWNTLTLLNAKNAEHPEEVFDFLVGLGTRFLQFIPCAEWDSSAGRIADFSVTPQQYGEFLCRLFDRWLEYGPTNLSVRDFDSILSYYITGEHSICMFQRQCNQYVVVEHTGDVFCCDFFVEPRWRIGNILDTPIDKLATDGRNRLFARVKGHLNDKCLLCRYLSICRGGCMKDRAVFNKEDFSRESYFCRSYKQFFDYALPKLMQIAARIKTGINTT